ncbi:RidA family protein [Paenibacillus flagellatus]|nr:RidA family protein [Paenibacillus flagellatus]
MDRQQYEAVKTKLGWKPDPTVKPPGLIMSVRVDGNVAYVSGHVAFSGGELAYKGRIGADVTIEEGKLSAALSTVNCLESLDKEVGLERVDKILKVTGYLSCAEHVTEHPAIMNAASELLIGVFGEAGKHARAALGIHTLPLGASTEVDMVVSLKG